MAITENLDPFLADFGVDVTTSGGATFKAIFDAPDEIIAGGMVLSTGYKIVGKSSDVSGLVNGSQVTISSASYLVREVRQVDDGSFSEVFLSKV